jgi:two-component system sensor histidine kinase TctE
MTTIRRRLLAMLLPALAILMFLGGLVDYWIAVSTTQKAYDQALASTAFATAAFLNIHDNRIEFTPSPRTAALLRVDGESALDKALYRVAGPSNEYIAGSEDLPTALGASASARVAFKDAIFRGQALRIVTIRVSTPAGASTISVGEAHALRERTQRVMLFGKLLVDFAEVDITLLLIWFAVYYGLRPLGELRNTVESHPLGELPRFDVQKVPGELRPVLLAFNRVLELLHDAAAAQHRFVADAAHQMRTPVAGLLAQLELLIQDPRGAELKPQFDNLQRGIAQLSHSANQLLALARAEPVSALHQKFQPVALKPIVEDLVERHLDRADRAHIDLGAEALPAEVRGDAWLLEDVLTNLIDNALKYTPQGGRVTVRSGVVDGHAQLEVEDDGPGIPENERQRVKERFYRRPGSPGTGCGLGLAIVEEIARAHQAVFSIGSGSDGRGTRMLVRFRAAAPRVGV